jgi:hypothetical protein
MGSSPIVAAALISIRAYGVHLSPAALWKSRIVNRASNGI